MSKMRAQDKDNKNLHDKLKQFFRLGNKGHFKSREDIITLTHSIEKEICSDSPINCRTKVIKELSDAVLNNQWEDCAAEKLWFLVQDLLGAEVPREHRHITLHFLKCLIQGQYSRLSSLMRVKFFNVIKDHDVPEDIGLRLELLQTLTENGKNITHLEEKMGPFLLSWMPTVTADGKRGAEFLTLLVNVIKFNSACIDEDIISGFVQYICYLCYYSNNKEVVSASLEALDTIVCYSKLQPDSLQTFIIALCRSVNVETYCQISWKIMKNLLGTHMGHSALYKMCYLLQEPNFQKDVRLLRGAVFYVNMGLWGSHRIPKLKCTPSSVLPSFYQALLCNHPIVMYEVTLSIQRLVYKYGVDLEQPTWSIILDIIEQVIAHTESSNQPATKQVSASLHETISSIENLLDSNCYNGNVQRFYELVERCSDARPEASVLKLIDYRASMIGPTCYQWQSKLSSLMERYYKVETRTNVRVKVLDILSNVLQVNRSRYEDELIERIVVPHLQHVETDPDVTIRNHAAHLLIDICMECESKRCIDLLDILERIINKPFTSDVPVQVDTDMKDVKSAVVGVIKILTQKVYRLPSIHAIRAYQVLVNHLELHFQDQREIFRNVPTIRYLIFECFLKARANGLGHLGFPDPSTGVVGRYSPYLVLENNAFGASGSGSASPPPASPVPVTSSSSQITNISLIQACKAVTTAIKQEKDWQVLQLILKELPYLLQNRALILSRHTNDIASLASALCSMIDDKTFKPADSLQNVPPKFTFVEFREYFYPVLAACTSYHAHFDLGTQQRLIKCFEDGLRTTCAGQCVTSLMTCTLEMRDTMSKLMSNVLLSLSKISDTVHIAIPILEFLSTLTRLPKVFANFTEEQYMSIFAIVLPYTKPTKYNHYTVSFAHHVIAVWFLKCRLPLRRNFAKYITKGLYSNAKMLLEEGNNIAAKPDIGLSNEDSSNRKRSSSLTEQGSRARKFVRENRNLDLKPPVDKALMNFHIELTETCIDLMARYSYSMYSARPKRILAADFLLKEGPSVTWILGNKLITVTTSGCSNKAMRGPLCDNCWAACKTSPEQTRSSHSSLLRASSVDGTREIDKLSRQSSGGHASHSSANTAANSPTEESRRSIDEQPPAQSNVDSRTKTDSNDGASEYQQQQQQQSESYKLELMMNSDGGRQEEHQPCACWCQGWAEIYVRRPTGDMSWVMRIQNAVHLDTPYDFPFDNITALYMPTAEMMPQKSQDLFSEFSEDEVPDSNEKTLEPIPVEIPGAAFGGAKYVGATSSSSGPIDIPSSPARPSPSRPSPRDSLESLEEGDDDSRKSRNPVRRSNSSPEMSSNWKNPFLNKEKLNLSQLDGNLDQNVDADGKSDADLKKHVKNAYSKDMRVSCEAIPEEIAGMGTTPPSTEMSGEHRTGLLSQKSYPGASQVTQTASATSATSMTVPPSPTATQPPSNLLSSKPPQSPTQAYPRPMGFDPSHNRQSWVVDAKPPIGRNIDKMNLRDERFDPSALPPLAFRDRGYTISVMSPAKVRRNNSPRIKDAPSQVTLPNNRSGINPSFVFLQLYHSAHFGPAMEKPLLVPQTNTLLLTSITNLDRIQPYETHKIGILYVGPGQATNEIEILANQHGSLRYAQFLQSLGTLVRLKDADESIFLGGLDRNGENGNFAYIWQDDVTQVAFHVATLMPSKASDPQCTSKKQHIGNDYVTIVYNESGEPYNIHTVKGQFNYACVVIQPLDHGTNQVTVQAREELGEHIGHSEPKIISDQNLAILSRQLALHANLASQVCSSLKQKDRNPYASNWLERLRQIKRLRKRVLEELLRKNPHDNGIKNLLEEEPKLRVADDFVQDFTDFTT